mgnify:FL=1
MASLVEVNKTLESIKGDTTNLNNNFEAWYKSMERSKGDELERERERMRLMRTMMAGMGAGAAVGGRGRSGGAGGGGPLGGLKIPKGLNPANWPLWAQVLSGSLLLKYGLKTADILSGGPLRRAGEKAGQKIVDAYDRRAEKKAKLALMAKVTDLEARLAAQRGAGVLTDVEAQADAATAKAAELRASRYVPVVKTPPLRTISSLPARVSSPEASTSTPKLLSPAVDGSARQPALDAAVRATAVPSLPGQSIDVRQVFQTAGLNTHARPLVSALSDAKLDPSQAQALESKYDGKFHVNKDGKVIFRKPDGTFSANSAKALDELSKSPTVVTNPAAAPKVGPARYADPGMGPERGRGSKFDRYLRYGNYASIEGALGEAALGGSKLAQTGSATSRILAGTGRMLLSNAFMTFGFAVTGTPVGLGSAPSEVMDAHEYGIYESLRKGDLAGAKKALKQLKSMGDIYHPRESQELLMKMSDGDFDLFGKYWMGYYKTEAGVKGTRSYNRMRKPQRDKRMSSALQRYQEAFDENVASGGNGSNINIGQIVNGAHDTGSRGSGSGMNFRGNLVSEDVNLQLKNNAMEGNAYP